MLIYWRRCEREQFCLSIELHNESSEATVALASCPMTHSIENLMKQSNCEKPITASAAKRDKKDSVLIDMSV